MRSRRGSALVEAAIFIPLITLLLVGMVNIARITYTYYTLRKTVYSIARFVGTQQGVNFCNPLDPFVLSAENFGVTGVTDGSQPAFVTGLTTDMFTITPEQYVPGTQTLNECCGGVPGCDPTQGGTGPDFIVVSIPNGYEMPLRIPGLSADPILLKPEVKVPYGGT